MKSFRQFGTGRTVCRKFPLAFRAATILVQIVAAMLVFAQPAEAAAVTEPSFSMGLHAGIGGSRDHGSGVAPRIWSGGVDANVFHRNWILGFQHDRLHQPESMDMAIFNSYVNYPSKIATTALSVGYSGIFDNFLLATAGGVGWIRGTTQGVLLSKQCEWLGCSYVYEKREFSAPTFLVRVQGDLMLGKYANFLIFIQQHINSEIPYFQLGIGFGVGKMPQSAKPLDAKD